MNNKKVLRAKRLFLPLAMPGAILILWLTALTAKSQADYYLFPVPAVNDFEAYPADADVTISPGAAGLSVVAEGTCSSSDFFCGVDLDLFRDTEIDVQGLIVDWEQTAWGSDETLELRISPSDIVTPLLGAYGALTNADAPPTIRYCVTVLDSPELEDFDCDLEHPMSLDAAGATSFASEHRGAGPYIIAESSDESFYLEVTMFWLVPECPEGYTPNGQICQDIETVPPPSGPVDPGAACSFNYTGTITNSDGTTGVGTYSYTVPANLVANYSFEDDDGTYPANWTVSGYEPPVGIFEPLFYGSGIFDARTGLNYVRPGRDNAVLLIQDLPLYSSGIYQAGFYYKCGAVGGTCSSFNAANLVWGTTNAASVLLSPSTPITYYRAISGTRATGGGSAWIGLELFGPTLYNDEIFVDDVFIWPVDEDGEVLCDPDYYPVPPGQPITSTVPTTGCAIVFGGLCFPSATDGACWQCQRPNSLLQLGEWITWLVCQVRNLFFCHLYHWLLVFANWVVGLYQNVIAFLAWLPTAAQNILNWIGNVWNNVLGWVAGLWTRIVTGFTNWLRTLVQNVMNSSFVQAVFNFVAGINYVWDLFVSLIEFFLDMLRAIFNGILDLINLVVDLVLAVREALLAEAYDWDFLPGFSGEGESDFSREAAIADEGGATWSETQVIYIFLMALAAGDAVLAEFGIQYIQFLIIGAISVGLIWWTLRKWEYILPV